MAIGQDQLVRILIAERAAILAYIRSIVRREDLAEDIFQEVSIRAVRKQEEILDPAHFLKWLRITARLEAMNVLRKTRTRTLSLNDDVLDALERCWDRHDHESDGSMAQALDECLKKLSPQHLRIIHERYGSGRKVGEVAGLLGRQVNSLYVTISRIHRGLADCIRRRVAETGADRG
jgi:RNA polymerase sigma-70 factor, ECF subfamily